MVQRRTNQGGRDKRGSGQPFTSGFATLRDVLSFVMGMAIIAHEVWWADTAEAAIIGFGLALTGLPFVLGADERGAKGGGAAK